MYHGVINVYKEKGFTSHDVVAKLRGILKQKKIGHTGTLDPDAEGVLPVCLGKGTKLCDMLSDKDKTYQTTLLLGKKTDTQDITGTILKEQEVKATAEEVRSVIQSFVGDYDQIPPMYSALKVNGKKLYELARQGIEIERKARTVHIDEINIEKIELPRVWMQVSCSKGTYIRTLCDDIGNALHCGGCMEELKRVRVGRFHLEQSVTLSEIEDHVQRGKIEDILHPIDTMFEEYAKVIVDKTFQKLIYNGNSFMQEHIKYITSGADAKITKRVRVYDEEKNFIGIYELDDNLYYKPVKMFIGG